MSERRYEFVVTHQPQSWPYADRWQCTLGDYDLDASIASATTPQDAMLEWLELHGDTLDQ